MSDLTDFLLARIADDEAQAREAIRERESVSYVDPANATRPDWSLIAWPDLGVPAMLLGPERCLAECDAKRRIVEHFGRERPEFWGQIAAVPLRALAAIYADHPDYRDEWKR